MQAASVYLGVKPSTVYDWRTDGKGPRSVKVGRLVKYRRSDLDEWLSATDPHRLRMQAPTPREARHSADFIGGEILAEPARLRQTQGWLAEQTVIPIATLSRRLRVSSSFRAGELFRIAAVLEVDVVRLLAP